MANKNDYSTLTPLIKSAPKILDLTNQAHLEQVIETVEKILLLFNSKRALAQLERDLFSQTDMPMLISLALKIAKSKIIVADIKEILHISVVFAVYKEHNRIKTRAEHEHGENFLLRKITQLQWLLKDSSNLTWDMIIVDGGCPEYSGKIAQEILNKNYDGHNVQVLFVEEAIKQRLPVIAPMTSIAESQKGGAIEYGMWVAAQQHKPNHIILFTDADLST
ncbi:MAG: hypothetical protein GY797_11885, partial [Deltaproteobacteria bacterium]|nr:hypothetical protein [Deltaproteobacteria bacterium]